MDKEAANRIAAAILTSGMMQRNGRTQDSETYVRTYKGVLYDLNAADQESDKKSSDSFLEALKAEAER